MKKVLPYLLAVFLLIGAVGHVLSPQFYAPMIPSFIPVSLANILATIAEAGIAIMLILPKYRKLGGLFFALLMLAFLPIHIWDMFKETPAVGQPPAPLIRLLIQFVLIFVGWWIYRKEEATSS